MASLTIISEGSEEKVNLDAATVTLGRGVESDVRLKDIKASRRHCQVIKTPQGFKCLDLDSGNGTFLNGLQIKEQKLNSGDKIQIGSTTITFIDGSPAAAKTAAPATAKTAAGARTATAKIPTASAPAKPATSKVPTVSAGAKTVAAKPATSAVPKITTQVGASKPATASTAKTSTAAIRKATTQKMGTTTKSIARGSHTERFRAEARRKKTSPVAILIGVIVAVFAVVVGWILFAPSGDPQILRDQIHDITTKAASAHSSKKYDEAVKLYRRALEMMSGNEEYKAEILTLKNTIKEIIAEKELFAQADARWAAFKDKAEKALADPAADIRPIWEEGQKLKAEVGTAEVSWGKPLDELLGKIKDRQDKDTTDRKTKDVQNVRKSIAEKCNLGDKTGKADYAAALKSWKEYREDKDVSDADKTKVDGEIRLLNDLAFDEIHTIGNRAKRMAEQNQKAESLDYLQKQKPRFEGTEALKKLEETIQGLDK